MHKKKLFRWVERAATHHMFYVPSMVIPVLRYRRSVSQHAIHPHYVMRDLWGSFYVVFGQNMKSKPYIQKHGNLYPVKAADTGDLIAAKWCFNKDTYPSQLDSPGRYFDLLINSYWNSDGLEHWRFDETYITCNPTVKDALATLRNRAARLARHHPCRFPVPPRKKK